MTALQMELLLLRDMGMWRYIKLRTRCRRIKLAHGIFLLVDRNLTPEQIKHELALFARRVEWNEANNPRKST